MAETEWTRAKILELLDRSDKAVWRAVHRVYKNQTPDERAAEATLKKNETGFNGSDAYILTKFAQFYERHNMMTPRQTALARKKIRKYVGQLLEAAR